MSIAVPLYGFGGGGGAALNFKVVGNPQPTSPKENTIWVNTDVKITGWYFSATQPENMSEGEVWFATSTESIVEFNALKKNAIQVYPLSAKQYIGGSLVNVDAKSYQNGVWVDWFVWDGDLYTNGSSHNEHTGGLKGYAYKFSSSGSTVKEPTLTFEDGKVIFSVDGGTGTGAATLFTEEPIDVTPYSKLKINVTNFVGGANPATSIGMALTKQKANSYTTAATRYITGTGSFELEIPSSINGEYYCVIWLAAGALKKIEFDYWKLER